MKVNNSGESSNFMVCFDQQHATIYINGAAYHGDFAVLFLLKGMWIHGCLARMSSMSSLSLFFKRMHFHAKKVALNSKQQPF